MTAPAKVAEQGLKWVLYFTNLFKIHGDLMLTGCFASNVCYGFVHP